MIFNILGHIDMIRNGLPRIEPCKPILIKTETRRSKRSIYQVEAERSKPHKIGYAVQRKRGIKAEPDIRIIFDRIWEEKAQGFLVAEDDKMYPREMIITRESAHAEGGYTPKEYETVWKKLNPNWDGWSRWAFEFHVIEVWKGRVKKKK